MTRSRREALMDQLRAEIHEELQNAFWAAMQVDFALRNLPLVETISVEQRRQHADVIGCAFALTEPFHMPAGRTVSRKTAKAELDKVSKLAKELDDHIQSLHRNTLEAIDRAAGKDDLKALSDAATMVRHDTCPRADQYLDRMPEPARAGPRKDQALAVAMTAAHAYQALTENPVTRAYDESKSEAYGPFLAYLRTVFDVLGIDASPEAQCKEVQARLSTFLSAYRWPDQHHRHTHG